MTTYMLRKKLLTGCLAGIEVNDTMTCDTRLGAPYRGGEHIESLCGPDYLVLTCEPIS